MTTKRFCVFFGLFLTLGWLAGCGPSDLPGTRATVPVSGSVSVDGQPLADGEVHFTKSPEIDEIILVKNGKFEGQASAGERIVKIYGFREAKPAEAPGGYTPPGGAAPSKENYIPAQYNEESTMKETVEANKTFEFKVTSNGAAPAAEPKTE